jgi:ankyrin repeat protein
MTSQGFTASKLIDSIRAGRLSDVIDALEAGADIEEADMHGTRGLPLRTACFEGNLAIVEELLRRGADLHAAASDGPGAPLRLALRRNHQDIVALLLQLGAHVPEGMAAAAPQLPDNPPTPKPATGEYDNFIEFTRTETDLTIEDRDVPASFGTETNALSMDILFLEENETLPPLPKAKE